MSPALHAPNGPHLRSVVEEELRGIAREVKRQSAPRRPAIPLPRAGSRPSLAARRQASGALAAARRLGSDNGAGGAGGAGLPPLAPQRSGSLAAGQLQAQPSSSFPAVQPLLRRQASGTLGAGQLQQQQLLQRQRSGFEAPAPAGPPEGPPGEAPPA